LRKNNKSRHATPWRGISCLYQRLKIPDLPDSSRPAHRSLGVVGPVLHSLGEGGYSLKLRPGFRKHHSNFNDFMSNSYFITNSESTCIASSNLLNSCEAIANY